MSTPSWCTRKEAAGALRVSIKTVDRYRKQGILKSKTTATGRILIDRQSLTRVMHGDWEQSDLF